MNWQIHQGLALQGQPEKARRVNYSFERLGLPVKNQKLILEVHDTSCTDWELKLFTSDNLGKAHGAYTRAIQDTSQASGIAHRDEFPEIPSNAQETGRTAWFNWVLVSPPFSPFLSRRHNSSLSSDQQVHPPSSNGLRSSLHLRQGVSSAHGAPNGDLLPEAPAESGNLLIEWPFKPVGLRHRVYHPDGRCPDLCDQVSTQEESFLQQQPFRRQQPER